MSIASATSRQNYTQSGSTTVYSYGFRILSASDLEVTKSVSGVETTLILNTDYTVSGVGASAGGNVTLSVAPAVGARITIRRVRDLTQETDIRNQGDFYPEVHEDTFDHLVMIAQQHQDELDRSVKLPVTITAADFDPTLPTDITSGDACVLAINATGDGFEVGPTVAAISGANADAVAAAASAADALASETAASASEAAALTSQTAAAASATSASTSAAAAASSATASQTSRLAAETAETNAETANTAAQTAKTAAETAQAAAATSATAASTSATNASNSATAAATSATNAANSATAAATSATNAASSATAAAASAASATGLASYADDAAFVTANGAAQAGDTYFNSTMGKIRYYNGSAWGLIGSGSGGGIQYLTNPDAETDATSWATYADAAGVSPVDGTGGAANITWTRSTVTPLRSLGHFLVTKDAANRQGQGASSDFSIALADQAKVLTISAEYKVMSGTYATGDLAVYVYDVTNALVIQPVGYQVVGAIGESKLVATFQSASNSTSYRLCMHVASTSASAYTVAFDSVSVGPETQSYGAFVSDWVPMTTPPTIAGLGTVSNHAAESKWVGDELWIRGYCTSGTATAVTLTIALAGYSLDTNKAGVAQSRSFGTLWRANSSSTGLASARGPLPLVYVSGSTTTLAVANATATASTIFTPVNGSGLCVATDNITYEIHVPIAGKGTNSLVSSETDTRVVGMRSTFSTVPAVTSAQPIVWDSVSFDTHGGMSAGRYTVRVPGKYHISSQIYYSSVATEYVSIYKNAAQTTVGSPGYVSSVEDTYNLVAGDIIDVRYSSSVTLTNWAQRNNFQIFMLQGPAQITASESVNCRYTTAAGQSITNGATPQVDFGTKDYDSHGAVTTGAAWKFTAPMAGKYTVNASILYTNGAFTLGNSMQILLYKNGSVFKIMDICRIQVTATQAYFLDGSEDISLLAGDYIDVRTLHGESAARSLINAANYSAISISRTGN